MFCSAFVLRGKDCSIVVLCICWPGRAGGQKSGVAGSFLRVLAQLIMRGGVMVTYRYRHSGLRVRISALHPIFLFCFFVIFLSAEVHAESLTYYIGQDTTLLGAVQSDSDDGIMPLADPLLYTLFQNRFYGYQYDRRVTKWNRLVITDTDDQHLAFEILDLVVGINAVTDALEAKIDGVATAENDVYSATQISKGDDSIRTDTPNLLGLVTQNQNSLYTGIVPSVRNSKIDVWYTGSNGRPVNLTSNVGLADILASNSISLSSLTKFFYDETQSSRIAYLTFDALGGIGGTYTNLGSELSVSSLLSLVTENQLRQDLLLRKVLTTDNLNLPMLMFDGSTSDTGRYDSLPYITSNGFAGLAQLLAGNSGIRTIDVTYVDPSNPLAEGVTYKFHDLFSYLSSYSTEMGTLLTKLQFVLASDQDIEMTQQEQKNKDTVYDDFFGDGQGAVKPSDITSASGLTGGAKDILDGAGSADQAFTAASDSDSYLFFSQEVANDLDQVGQPSLQHDEDIFEGLIQDEDGFWSLGNSSMFDLDLYLREKAGDG